MFVQETEWGQDIVDCSVTVSQCPSQYWRSWYHTPVDDPHDCDSSKGSWILSAQLTGKTDLKLSVEGWVEWVSDCHSIQSRICLVNQFKRTLVLAKAKVSLSLRWEGERSAFREDMIMWWKGPTWWIPATQTSGSAISGPWRSPTMFGKLDHTFTYICWFIRRISIRTQDQTIRQVLLTILHELGGASGKQFHASTSCSRRSQRCLTSICW